MASGNCRVCGKFLNVDGSCSNCLSSAGNGVRPQMPQPAAVSGYASVDDRIAAAQTYLTDYPDAPPRWSVESNDVWTRHGLPHADGLDGYVSPDGAGRWRADVVMVDGQGYGQTVDTKTFANRHAAAQWIEGFGKATEPQPPSPDWSVQSNDVWSRNGLPNASDLNGYVGPGGLGRWDAYVVAVDSKGMGRSVAQGTFTSKSDAAQWIDSYEPPVDAPPSGWSVQSNDVWSRTGLPNDPSLDGYVSPDGDGRWRADVVRLDEHGTGFVQTDERFDTKQAAAEWLDRYQS